MKPNLNPADVHRLAALELNLFNSAHALPGLKLEGASLDPGTPIYDPTGEVLYYRVPLRDLACARAGYADIAAHTLFGAPLLAVAPDPHWDAQRQIAEAQEAFERLRRERKKLPNYDEIRLVSFSFPKLAAQFLEKGKEVIMLELGTWAIVPPPVKRRRRPMEPTNFERWSLIEEMPAGSKRSAHNRFQKRASLLGRPELRTAANASIIAKHLLPLSASIIKLNISRELHYSTRSADHFTCYELRGQETNVWCVGASVQMVLDFYRYEYSQVRLAQALGLGTLTNPNGLPYSRVNDITIQLNALSSGALTAQMLTTPAFSTYVNEINANRPLLSIIPGHARTVAGYTQSLLWLLGGTGFRGLLVYDPWPPGTGVITRWENFDTQTYLLAYTARVTTV